MIYGWGTTTESRQLDETTVAVCRYRYVSLLFVLSVVWQRRWFLQGRDRASDREVTADEIEQIYGAGAAPTPGLWRRFGLFITIGAFLVYAIAFAIVGAIVDDDSVAVVSEPVAEFAGDDDADSSRDASDDELVDESDTAGAEAETPVADRTATADEDTGGDDTGSSGELLAAPAIIEGVSGSYSHVDVAVVEVRTAMADPLSFNYEQPDATPQDGDERWVYVELEFDSQDPNNWFDFGTDLVRLSIGDQMLAAGRDFNQQSFRSEPRSVERFRYGFQYDGPIDLNAMAIVIGEGTVPLVLPIAGDGAANPYPITVAPPEPISYLDGAFLSDQCGFRNEITFTDVAVDLQEPAEWDVTIFLGPKRARAGHRQLIVRGFGDRVRDSSCSSTPSDISPDQFRLLIDGRPAQADGAVFGDTRGLEGDITEFQLLWEIPVSADLVDIEITGSTGDAASAVVDLGQLPLVEGE